VRELTVEDDETERAFLDANVIRGQLTNDILLSLAEQDLLNPRWSQTVLDEMRRNRPAGVSEQRIDRRIAAMNTYFPRAMTSTTISSRRCRPMPRTNMSWQPQYTAGAMCS
jgi:hypothetical protein